MRSGHLVLVTCLSGLTMACSGNRPREAALESVAVLHGHIAFGDYERIWLAADEQFRQAEVLHRQDFDWMRKNLGAAQQFWPRRTVVYPGFFEDLVVLEGDTQFSKGWAHERFEWRVKKGEQAILKGYNMKYSKLGQ